MSRRMEKSVKGESPLYRKKAAIVCLITFFAMLAALQKPAAAQDVPSVSAQAAALLCVNNGTFLFEKNAQEKLPMASTTKIMTTLLTLEAAAAQNKTVTVTEEMYAEGSSMYLKAGDQLKLTDLAAGMMMASGNDAANAAALAVGGSFEGFAQAMNQKAQQIGMENSHFVTPSGLDDDAHYSTAQDMALLMDCAVSNDAFADISGQKSMKVTFIKPQGQAYTYNNHNRLLSLYEYCTGGKTGFTDKAGRCLVTSAEKDGVKLIAVTLHAPDDWNDHIKLYEYGFEQLTRVSFDDTACHIKLPLAGGKEDYVRVSGYTAADVVVPNADKDKIVRQVSLPPFVYAPVEAGQVLGKVVYTLNGEKVASNDLVADGAYAYEQVEKGFFEKIGAFFLNLFS